MNKNLAFLGTSIGALEVMDSAKWMNEGITKLDGKGKSFHGRIGTFELRVFVFKNFFIQAFEAILMRGEITLKEANLIDTIVQNYLSDGLLAALNPSESDIIHKLLLPFASSQECDYADDQSTSVMGKAKKELYAQATIQAMSALSKVTSAHQGHLRAAMDGHKIRNTPDYARLVCSEMDRNPYNLTMAQIELAKTFETHIH